MSLDEAYIDITDYLLMNPDANAWDSVQVSLLILWTESFKYIYYRLLTAFKREIRHIRIK